MEDMDIVSKYILPMCFQIHANSVAARRNSQSDRMKPYSKRARVHERIRLDQR